MYKIPDDIQEDFLQGEKVQMICFNINQVYIHFESSIFITIEGNYIFRKNGIEQLYNVYPVLTGNHLLSLIGEKIEKTAISNSREDISIYFNNDTSIDLLSSKDYESYMIDIDGRRIII